MSPPAADRDPTRHRAAGPVLSGSEVAALALSAAWLGLVGWFFLTLDPDTARLTRADPRGFAVTVLGVLLPVVLLWVAAASARMARALREEGTRLRAALNALRRSYAAARDAEPPAELRAVADRLDEIARRQAALEAQLAAALAAPPAPEAPALTAPARPDGPRQAALALDAEAPGADALPAEDVVRALNFPDNARDREGFAVLRRALRHRPTAQAVTAAQDALTLLSQDGIYMDDLAAAPPAPAVWRAFADGVRGPEVAAMGGVRDRAALALAAGRMRDDPVFRDAAHQFLRAFDRALAGFAPDATDGEVAALSQTRSARAFMLLGRVAGLFA